MNLAIMQPCYLPWRGYFALLRLADLFIHLDDVQLPLGRSLHTRVAIKTPRGREWLSLPIERHTNQTIADAPLANDHWRRKHRATLRQNLPAAAELVADLYDRPWSRLADLDIAFTDRIASHLGITTPTCRSSEFAVESNASDRILELCRTHGATRYLTGHGARNYLEHEAFDRAGIEVAYLDYDLSPYPQPHGEFDPYVTILDLLNHVINPVTFINARLVPWRDFISVAA
jgi:hypothetical protein